MRALGVAEDAPQGRPPDDRPAHRREPSTRRVQVAAGVAQLRADDAGARVCFCEFAEDSDCVRRRLGVRVADDDERRGRLRDAAVCVCGVARRTLVLDQLCTLCGRPGQVRDDDQLVYLRPQRGEAAFELRARLVYDDDAGDAHRSSR